MHRNFAALSGLRAFAALAVVCFHYCPPPPLRWANAFIQTGPAAVGFFLLSGFVLALNHPQLEDVPAFWRARLVRIYPMYLVAFVLFAPIAIAKYHADAHLLGLSFALNVTMLQAWTDLAQSWNGPSWSLSVEAFLYAVFPLVLPAIAKRANPLWFVLPLALPVGLTIAFCGGAIPAHVYKTWIGNDPLFWLPMFCLGVALGLWRARQPESAVAVVPPGPALAAAVAALIALVIGWPPAWREVFIAGGDGLVLAAIVVLCTYRSRIAAGLFGRPLVVRLGSASYIMYIMQAPLFHYYARLTRGLRHAGPLAGNAAPLLFFAVFVAGLCAVSVALERYVDEPLRARLRQRARAAKPHFA